MRAAAFVCRGMRELQGVAVAVCVTCGVSELGRTGFAERVGCCLGVPVWELRRVRWTQ